MSLFENPTQAIGIIAFSSTFLSCMLAGRFTACTIWKWLAAIYLLFVMEIAIGWRHGFRVLVNNALQSVGIYGDRTMIQLALMAALLLFVLLISAPLKIWANQTTPQSYKHYAAISATVLLILLFILEFVSFHWLDVRLYAPVAGLILIGWLWIGLAAVVIASALWNILDVPSSSIPENER